jgi:NAD(P)-dependent dehydrogenase (short-subunit alcohol dehydrogenase family)|tara:strand:+ start:178 stop:972 length:795 start_codon:yes stop_codon:yes gene_type:complete
MTISKIFNLSNKVIILTGASGLLGTEYAHGLSQAGANVVLADLNFETCKKLSLNLNKKYGVDSFPIKLDVTKTNSINTMIKKVIKKFLKIDILINNAIFSESGNTKTKFENYDLDIWKKGLDVNLTGPFLCCQEVGKIMKKQKNGNIINISSIYGLVSPDQRIYGNTKIIKSAMYAVTKSSILNFTRYLASYWREDGIRVNTLSLGGVEENQNPIFKKNYSNKTMIGRMAKKDEYVGGLIFLSSNASSYMTGSNLVIDGGWTAW